MITLMLLSLYRAPNLSKNSIFFTSLGIIVKKSAIVASMLLILKSILLPLIVVAFLFWRSTITPGSFILLSKSHADDDAFCILEVGINIKRSDFVMIFEPFTTTSDKLKILDVSDKFFDIVSVTIKSEPIVKRHFSPLKTSKVTQRRKNIQKLFLIISFY